MSDYLVHKAVELTALSKKLQATVNDHEYILSPKYDGCHAIFLFDDGKFLAARSRTNETVHSMDHVGAQLLDLYPWLQYGKHAIMGEAWVRGLEFSEISGIFRRHSPQLHLCFVPFDQTVWRYDTAEDGRPVLGEGINDNTGGNCWVRDVWPYEWRLNMLSTPGSLNVIRPRYRPISGLAIWEAAELEARGWKQQGGYDGAVLARADGLYQVGAGKGGEFIKVKPLISLSLKVTAVISDIGGKTGKNTCSIVVDLDGQVQKVSTGLLQQDVDAYTSNPKLIIGKIIEVEAMGYTVNGLLREPRYKGIRTDVL